MKDIVTSLVARDTISNHENTGESLTLHSAFCDLVTVGGLVEKSYHPSNFKLFLSSRFVAGGVRLALCLIIFALTAVRAFADATTPSITVQLSEGSTPASQRGTAGPILFANCSSSRALTVANTLIVPGYAEGTTRVGGDGKPLVDFAGSIAWAGGTIQLDGNNKLDCETFYFLKDYNATGNVVSADLSNQTLWAYSFTGWHITNTPLSTAKSKYIQANQIVPANTVFQPGDVITPDILQDFGITDSNGVPTGVSLQLEALWGKCFFVKNGATSTTANNVDAPALNATAASLIPISTNAYDYVMMLCGDATRKGLNCRSGYKSIRAYTFKSLQSVKSGGGWTQTDGKRYTLTAEAEDQHNYANFRVDNVIAQYSSLNTDYYSMNNTPAYVEFTARMTGPFGSFYGIQEVAYVFNGGNIKNAEWLGWERTSTYDLTIWFGRNAHFIGNLIPTGGSENNVHNGCCFITVTGGIFDDWLYLQSDIHPFNNSVSLSVYGDRSYSSEYDPVIPQIAASPNTIIKKDVHMDINGCTKIGNLYGGGETFTATSKMSVYLTVLNSDIQGSINTGGKFGSVDGTANLYMKNSSVKGNVYGSGMGSTSLSSLLNGFEWGQPLSSSPHSLVANPPQGFPNYNKDNQAVLMCTVTAVNWWSHEGSGRYNILVFDNWVQLSSAYAGNTKIVMEDCTIGEPGSASAGNIYGGGADATVNNNTIVSLKNCTVFGSVYGGGDGVTLPEPVQLFTPLTAAEYTAPTTQAFYDAYMAYKIDMLLQSPSPYDEAFHREYYNWSNDPAVLAAPNNGIDNTRKLVYSENMVGWGDVNGSTNVRITGGLIHGNVFGGGNAGKVGYNSVEHTSSGGGVTLSIDGTHVMGNVYGGCNQADVAGSIDMDITNSAIIDGSVYGGCNLEGTIAGNTDVTIVGTTVGTAGNDNAVFGGGFGEPTLVSGNVDVKIGTTDASALASGDAAINGDVYGGSALGNVNGTTVDVAKHTIVNLISGLVNGSVYGGGLGRQASGDALAIASGDASGDASPVEAKVYGPVQVTMTSGKVTGGIFGCNNLNGAPQSTVTVDINGTDAHQATPLEYAVGAVYGGGNKASYSGVPVVSINSCDASIGSVYGGGNAAATGGTNATIWGGTIGEAFGGGNGTVGAANVNGNSSLTIHGGEITSVYAGSNTSGLISGTMALNIDRQARVASGDACPQNIGEVYGGGNQAPGKGAVITIGCGTGYLGNVYGGSRNADIAGDLTLNIRGGEIDNVFGGNNVAGAITGAITVNIDIAACPTAKIKNVYGGGNLASYTAPVASGDYPQVNLISGTVGVLDTDGVTVLGGNVFGGGLGASATVIGNPVVNLVGYTPTGADDPHADTQSIVLGSIFGGGDAAGVTGNTTVNLTKGTVNKVFGAGLGTTAVVTGNPMVNVNGATIGTDVYGGGSLASVTGKTSVNVVSGTVTGNVYGGGLGQIASGDAIPAIAANVSDSTIVNFRGGSATNVFGCNNLNGAPQTGAAVTMTGGTVTSNVYGGGNLAAASVSPIVTVSGGSTNKVFGGGYGATAIVTGNPQVSLTGTTVGDVFGGGDQASLIGSPTLSITGGQASNIFGGGNKALVTGNPSVSVTAGTHGTVFGGGNAANVEGTPTVTVTGASTRITGNVFGGGNQGDVTGSPKVTVGGTDL